MQEVAFLTIHICTYYISPFYTMGLKICCIVGLGHVGEPSLLYVVLKNLDKSTL